MKNKRQISKVQTFNKLIQSAKEIVIKKGVLNTSTYEIAKKAGIAHGTLFAHFKTKESLIIKIFKDELLKIASELKKISYKNEISLRELITNYIELMIDDEELFVIMSREFPFFHEEIKNDIIATESIIRNVLYKKIEEGIAKSEYLKVDITMSLSFLFGTVNLYLSRKEYFVNKSQSVLKEKKNSIINTFFQLLTK